MYSLKQVRYFRESLLHWFDAVKRDLPWRREPTLYKTVVSEFMLQQTQVVTVIPYFNRWIERFPNFEALASVDEEIVLKYWEGLGYYQRARHLHKLAKVWILQSHIPQTVEDWEKLPGIGPYTAAAINSIAQNQPAAVIDGNLIRILTRLSADARLFKGSQEAHRLLKPFASGLLDVDRPGDFNEAMMELGATVCTKHNPRCSECPVKSFCEAYRLEQPTAFPILKKKVIQKRFIKRILCIHNEHILLEKLHARAKRLANCYELPVLSEIYEKFILNAAPFKVKKRGIAQEIIEESIYKLPYDVLKNEIALEWVPMADVEKYRLSGPHRRWLREWGI